MVSSFFDDSKVLDYQSKIINVIIIQLKNFRIALEINWRHFDHQLSLISFESGPLVDFNGEHNLNLSFFFAFKSSCFPWIFDIILTNLTIILILFSYSWYYCPFYDFIKWSCHDFYEFKKNQSFSTIRTFVRIHSVMIKLAGVWNW